MRILTTNPAMPALAERARSAHPMALPFAGIALAAFVPAIFWCVLLELASRWFGHALPFSTLAIIGGSMALFLATICAPLMLRRSGGETGKIRASEPRTNL